MNREDEEHYISIPMEDMSQAEMTEEISDVEDDSTAGKYQHPNLRIRTNNPGHTCQCRIQSHKCFLVIYLWIGLLLVACAAALVIISLLVVKPYVKADKFIAATCQPVNAVYSSNDQECSCGKGCSVTFPCLREKVNLQDLCIQVECNDLFYVAWWLGCCVV